MNRKNSYAIAALLVTVVPFATGCEKPCGMAKELRNDSEQLSDTMFAVSQSGGKLEVAQCAALLAAASSLNNKSDLKKITQWASEQDSDIRKSAKRVKAVAGEIALRVQIICGSDYAGLGEAASGEGSFLRSQNSRELSNLIELELVTSGEPLIRKACGDGKTEKKHRDDRKAKLYGRAQFNAPAPAGRQISASSAAAEGPPVVPGHISPKSTDNQAAPARHEERHDSTPPASPETGYGGGYQAGSAEVREPAKREMH